MFELNQTVPNGTVYKILRFVTGLAVGGSHGNPEDGLSCRLVLIISAKGFCIAERRSKLGQ